MTTTPDPFDDLIITFRPDATPEEEERFLSEFAFAVLAVARHIIATQPLEAVDDEKLETIEF
jgi:hypothetical protein